MVVLPYSNMRYYIQDATFRFGDKSDWFDDLAFNNQALLGLVASAEPEPITAHYFMCFFFITPLYFTIAANL